jgi:thioredoxin-related protein
MNWLISIVLFINMHTANLEWHHNLNEAKQIAAKEHKLILLNFSGSDWCGPCIRLHKEVFTQLSFQKIAEQNLVLVNADFPRNKKNQLPPAQQKLNDAMADQYNPKGAFPYTLLINANGKIIKEWDGFPKSSIESFIQDIEQNIEANHS